MLMKVELVEISTYNVGNFLIQYEGQVYACRLENKNEWDKLYDYLNKPMWIDADPIHYGHYIVHEIR